MVPSICEICRLLWSIVLHENLTQGVVALHVDEPSGNVDKMLIELQADEITASKDSFCSNQRKYFYAYNMYLKNKFYLQLYFKILTQHCLN